MRSKLIIFSILLSAAAVYAGKFDNILLYKNFTTWNSNLPVIPKGQPNEGRINWSGQRLVFTPRNGDYNTEKTGFLSYMIQVPKELTFKMFTIKLIYRDGKTVARNFYTPRHDGWQVNNFFFGKERDSMFGFVGPTGHKGMIKQVEFSTKVRGFRAVLDDIHFIDKVPSTVFPDHFFPKVTTECYFPEFTRADVIAETLADPEFKAKKAELERLRKIKLPLPLREMHLPENQVAAKEAYSKIMDDGSLSDFTFADGARIHRERNFLHNANETFVQFCAQRLRKLLEYWQGGRIPRTKENKIKVYKALVRYIGTDMNRRGERFRYIGPAFIIPGLAVYAYRLFYEDMDAVENGLITDQLTTRLNRVLKEASSWCYTFPLDRATAPFLTVDSFRFSSAWTGGNFGYRPAFHTALICRNPRMMDVVSQVTQRALEYISHNNRKTAFWIDAMTPDGSAWGHGPQNYPLGYPLTGIRIVGELIKEFRGTRWAAAANADLLKNVCNYFEATLWHGTGWTNNYLQRDLLTGCGRIAQQYKGIDHGYSNFGAVIYPLRVYMSLFPDGSPEKKRLEHCMAVIRNKAPMPVGLRYFWNNDLLLCRQKDAVAAVTMLSSRVRSCENATSDSHMTDFWTDGSAWINKPFDAYRVARGFFRQTAIPGVTSRQWKFTHEDGRWRTYTGKYNFAGGVTNGDYAACGYQAGRQRLSANPDRNFYNLDARKAYFWFNGKLICLTAGINDAAKLGVPVATTLDQTLWRAPITYDGKTAKPGEKVKSNAKLLWHNGIGYAVLRGKGVLSAETRKARWEEFDGRNKTRKDLPKTAPIIMFQIDHGKNPQNETGAYMVDLNCKDFASLKKFADKPSIEIISLTPDVQAVRERSSGTLAAVIHIPGGKAGDLQVEDPAVVLLREFKDGRVQVTISDPRQDPKLDSTVIKWKNKYYRIKLPTGIYSGKPVTEFLNNQNNIKEYKMKKTTIALALAAVLSCSANNLLKNADFQKADSKGRTVAWNINQKFSKRVKDAELGKTVISTTVTLPKGSARLGRHLTQVVKVDKPGKYCLSFTAKVVDNGIINASWSFYDANKRMIKVPAPWWTAATPTTKKWETVTREFTTPENAKTVRIYITCRIDKGMPKTGTMLVRDVKLVRLGDK